jgi:hypothetical protein
MWILQSFVFVTVIVDFGVTTSYTSTLLWPTFVQFEQHCVELRVRKADIVITDSGACI